MKDSHFFKVSNKKGTTKHFFLTNFITLTCRELNSLQDALRFAFLNSEEGDEKFKILSMIVEVKKTKIL